MSGPKSMSVAVVPAAIIGAPVALAAGAVLLAGGAVAGIASGVASAGAEVARQRRARREARVKELAPRAADLSRELGQVAEQWRAARDRYGEEFPAWPHGDATSPEFIASLDRPEDLERCILDLTRRVTLARTACASQSAVFRMRASLGAAARSSAGDAPALGRSPADEPAPAEEYDPEHCAEQVSRLIDELAAEVSSEARAAIETRAQEAVESPLAARRKALLVQLRLDIQRANETARARRRTVEMVEGWRERLTGLAGPEVEELDAALRQVLDGGVPLPPDMAQRVEDLAARAAESTRDYALGVIREELENLGYAVEAGFETASAEAPEMLLSKPDLGDDYHVSLRAEAGASRLHARVVREADDDASDAQADPDRERTDGEAERAWCRDLAAAMAAAERKGLHARVERRTAAGAAPVQTIPPLERKDGSRKKSRRKRAGRRLKSRAAR